MQNRLSTTRTERRGAALLMAIIALLIITTICMSLTKTLTLRHAHFERAVWKQQAQLLAHSAMQRTLLQLKKDPEFAGETWSTTFDSGITQNGSAVITIDKIPDSNTRSITIITHVPDDAVHRAQVTITSEVQLP